MRRNLALSLALLASLAVGVTVAPAPAEAFCGFYVAGADAKLLANATMVVLMRDGKRTVLSMQNDYQGPPEAFAMVVPVPVVLREDDVKVLRKDLFDRVDTLAAPRLVEYWEQDPCGDLGGFGFGSLGLIGKGGGGTGLGYGRGGGSSTVKVEAEFAVGEYEIVILSATESTGLDTWLRANGYNIPAGAEPLLRPYVEQGSKFFVAKVDPSKVEFAADGKALLSPLRFHYDSDEFTLPVRLGLINAPPPKGAGAGKQDLIVHVLAPHTRYQLANYPNATIPTNLDVQDRTRENFGSFYAALFEHTLAKTPGAVVTEYAWSAGGCDPCPGPDAALTNQELLELGADVLPNWSGKASGGGSGLAPLVSNPQPEVGPGLDKDIVRRIVRAHMNEVRFCYSQALAATPALAGDVSVEFTIAANGDVSIVRVGKSTLADPKVEACVAKAVKRWKFPKPTPKDPVAVTQTFTMAPTGGPAGSFGGGFGGGGGAAASFVLTRLHARYDATSLGEDLVFEAAEPITGGREVWFDGKLEQGAVTGSFNNNFQARFAIRHEWTGALDCEQPTRGFWAGPPDGASGAPTLARRGAEPGKGGGSLGSFVTASASEQLGVAIQAEPAVEPEPEPAAEPEPTPTSAAPAEPSKPATEPSKPAGACVCSTTDERTGGPALTLGLLTLLGLVRRRRSAPGVGVG
jgi:TonB family protein